MEQSKIDRINEFARRVKAGETLTTEEQAERPPCAGNISTASRPTWQPNWTAPILWSRTALSTSCQKAILIAKTALPEQSNCSGNVFFPT